MYHLLSAEQRKTVDTMKAQNKLFNYVDQKDPIALGYLTDGSKAVGNVFFVLSNAAHDPVKQHMWGGYQFTDDGRLLITEDSMAIIQLESI